MAEMKPFSREWLAELQAVLERAIESEFAPEGATIKTAWMQLFMGFARNPGLVQVVLNPPPGFDFLAAIEDEPEQFWSDDWESGPQELV
jgi:hypothetical protein